MKKTLIIFSLLFSSLFAKNSCFSINTEAGVYTPIYPINTTSIKTCKLKENPIVFDISNGYYIGCYKTKKEVMQRYKFLKKSGFHFKNEKIVKIYPTFSTPFIIFPYFAKSTQKKLSEYKKDFLLKLKKLTPSILKKQIPTQFYGNGIELKNIDSISLLPIPNIFSFYRYYKSHNLNKKMIILYNGVYNLDIIKKQFPSLIQKIDSNTYIIKAPIYIAKNATLVIQNSKVLLETYPKPIFIIYHGKLFINNSHFITYNTITKKYEKREKIKKNEILLVGKQKPRPYVLGLSGSYTLMLNSTFKGLGFHDSVATFGISLAQMPPSMIYNSTTLLNFLRTFKPEGTYVGNNIYNCMMGFYCANVKNVNIVGNYIHDNIIYNVDPHDYSENLLIARNILSRALHAHGVVISRGVKKTFIAQNISINNNGDGIMLDRMGPDNIVYDNITFNNGIMGISIQESDNNLIEKNFVAYNLIDGIIVRNSLNTLVKNNNIIKNGRNGIEILTKNIDDILYRDFPRDPYHKATSCVVKNNIIKNNFSTQITLKNNAALKLINNNFNQHINLLGGDLLPFTNKIIKNHFNFEIYGVGNPFHPISTDKLKIKSSFSDIFIDLSKYNDYSGIALANIYQLLNLYNLAGKELKREASNLIPKALELYAFYKIQTKHQSKQELIKNISYILESAIMNNQDAEISAKELKYVFNITKKDIQKAYIMAKNRMEKGEIFSETDKNDPVVCKFPSFTKKVIRSYINIFTYNLQNSDTNNIVDYFEKKYKNYSVISPYIITLMQKLYKEKNLPKIRYNDYIKKKEKLLICASRLCRRYLQKNAYFINESNSIIKSDLKNNINKYKNVFSNYLKLINKYRNNPISTQTVIDILKTKGIK